jgi:hypothetical protein
MTQKELLTPAAFAILTMAEIKSAADDFNRGTTNVFDALDAICAVVRAYRAAAPPRRNAA